MDKQDMGNGLALYRYLEYLGWPRSYIGKLFLIAFLSIHVPLLSLIAYALSCPAESTKIRVFGFVLLTMLGGMSLGIWGLRELLKPVQLAIEALDVYFAHGQVLQLPTRFRDEVGALLTRVGYALQTFEQRRMRLEQVATEDFLTGLLNRRAAEDRLRQSISLAARNHLPLCVALMDVDWFKQINDKHGHTAGDQVLVRLSQHLRQILRESDWVARWGGEEFLLVMFAEAEGARIGLERIRQELAQLRVPIEKREISFTVSIGYTVVQFEEPFQACLNRADAAMYQAKEAGRNRVQLLGD